MKFYNIKNILITVFLFTFVNNLSATNSSSLAKESLNKNSTIKLMCPIGYEPVSFRGENGRVQGIIIDYFKEINKFLENKIELIYYKPDSEETLISADKNSSHGNAMIFNNSENRDDFELTEPYMYTPFIIFTSKDKIENIKKIDNLKNKRVAVLRDNLTAIDYLKSVKDIDIIISNSPKEQLELLQYKRVDAILGYKDYHYLINKFLFDDIYPAFTTEKSLGLRIGLKSEYKSLISILNSAISKLNREKKQRIISKWLSGDKNRAVSLLLTDEERAYLKEKKSLTVANLETFPPFNFYEEKMPKGYSIDYIKLMGEKLNIDIEFISKKSWSTYLNMLKDGSLDFIPHIAITKDRKEYIDYTNFKHVSYYVGIVARKNSKIKKIDDLEDKKIALAKKTFLHEYIKRNFPEIELYVTQSTKEAVEAVSSGRADVVVGSLPSLNYYIQKEWLNNLESIEIDNFTIPIIRELPMGVVKGNTLLKSILEKANSSISGNEAKELKLKWMDATSLSLAKDILSEKEREYLRDKKEITMCIDPNWMPFEKNDDGKHIGMSSDYIKLFQKTLQVPVKMIPTDSWGDSLEYIKNRECDILSLVMETKKRLEYLAFTKPYINTPLIIATKIDEFFINDVTSVVDKKIGVVKNYAYAEILKEKYPEIELVKVESIDDGLKKVRDKKLFGFIGTLSTVGYTIQKSYIGELKIAGKFDESWALGVGVRSDEPILRDIFNKIITRVTKQEHQHILNKWISINYQSVIDYSKVLQVSLFFIIIIALLMYQKRSIKNVNRKLIEANKEIKEQQKMVNKYVLMLTTDLNGIITDANYAYSRAMGFSREELIGTSYHNIKHKDMPIEIFSDMFRTLRENRRWIGEIQNSTKKSETCWLNSYIEPIFKDGEKVGYRTISEDITDKKRIEELSITDKLTGLYNRLKLDDFLIIKVEEFQRYKTPFSVILLDIDNFKMINDNFGHDIGDKALQKLANLLKNSVRKTDLVGRWGGEEFIIVCNNTDENQSYIVAENVRKLVESSYFEVVGKKTVSLGVSQFRDSDTISSIFKRVDDALYKAKKSGKNKTILS